MSYTADQIFEGFEKAEDESTASLLSMRDALNETLVEVEDALSQVRSIGDNYRETEMRLKGGTLSPVIEEESLSVLIEIIDAVETFTVAVTNVSNRSSDIRGRMDELTGRAREINQHIVNRMP